MVKLKNTERLHADVLGAIRHNLGAEDENDTSHDEIINKMCNQELFRKWCNWHGLVDWSHKIERALRNISY